MRTEATGHVAGYGRNSFELPAECLAGGSWELLHPLDTRSGEVNDDLVNSDLVARRSTRRPTTERRKSDPLAGNAGTARRKSVAVTDVTGSRELVHGERESFIGGYGWQGSGPSVGSPRPNVGGGGT